MYAVLGLALFGTVSLFGLVSSYARMALKTANYNAVRDQLSTVQKQYQKQQRAMTEKDAQLASLQMMASEVTVALGIGRKLEGAADIANEGPLVPSFKESLEQYNFLRSASFSRSSRAFQRTWHKNVIPTVWPVNGQIISRFGQREDPFSGEGGLHWGVDITAAMETPVHAAADAVVIEADWMQGYGKRVVLEHGNGMRTWYAHLSKFSVVPGQEIRRGEILGYSGSTGRSTGPHLHFEVRVGGSPVNPYSYLKRAYAVQTEGPDLPF
jgi:murein DD-endopeptidase MepM/ murein hydrolase activator NlpD